MSIIYLMLVLAVIGVVAWALVTYIPMPSGMKTLIVVVAVVCGVLYALNMFGIGLPNPAVPKLR